MHLHYLLEKKNRHCLATEGVAPARRRLDGEDWFGALLPAGRQSRITLVGASEYPQVQAGVDDVGLVATVAGGRWFGRAGAQIAVSFVAGGARVTRTHALRPAGSTRLLLPSL